MFFQLAIQLNHIWRMSIKLGEKEKDFKAVIVIDK
jgi:hypothetical protein